MGYRGNGLWEMVRGELGDVLGGVVLARNRGRGWFGFWRQVFIVILLGFPGPSDGLRLHPIVFFSSGSGLTADSSVLTLTLAFLDFGLDFAQSFPFHAHTNSNSSTNEADNTVYGVSSAHTQSNPTSGDNLSDAVIYAFLASQTNSPQMSREDLEQIDPDDLEEMDLQ
ncbi:hypothetical protein Tco_1063938 [Tanacetum coccineum]